MSEAMLDSNGPGMPNAWGSPPGGAQGDHTGFRDRRRLGASSDSKRQSQTSFFFFAILTTNATGFSKIITIHLSSLKWS
jgi:hypothetical protein